MTRAEFIQRAVLVIYNNKAYFEAEEGETDAYHDSVISRAEALADRLEAGKEARWDPPGSLEPPAGDRLVDAVMGLGTAEAPLFVRQDPPVPLDQLGLRTPEEARCAENYVNDARAIVEIQLALNEPTQKGEKEDKAERRRMGGIRRVMESHAARRK
jgi:hypothetical protein